MEENLNKNNFANIIKNLRIQKKMTQQDLAEIVGLTPTGISYWESGKSIPNIETLEKLAIFFNVTVDYLLGKKEMSDNDKKSVLFRKAEDVPPEEREVLWNIIDGTIDAFLNKYKQ